MPAIAPRVLLQAPPPRMVDRRLLLQVPASAWAPPASPLRLREGIELAPMRELHITLVGSELGAELHRTLGAAFLRDALRAETGRHDWRFERSGRWLLLRKHDRDGNAGPRLRHALVELVRMPAMAPLHRALGRLLGRQLPVPPPHVTLYAAGSDRGIGLPAPAMLRACALRPVSADELARP